MKLYGLIGYPLGHSLSKKYFSNKFQTEGLKDCRYDLFPIPSIVDLPSLINSNPFLRGLNVTIPYKQQVLEYVTEITSAVREIGATNTIKIDGNKLTAYNTDVIGFEDSLVKKLKSYHTKALVLGTGGASKAVQYVLRKLKIEFLLVSRQPQEGKDLIAYSMINETVMKNYTVIINCTPVGMYPNEAECPPLPYHFISDKHYLFDLITNPEKTLFLENGEKMGAVIQNGYEMFIMQAEESWKIWNED